MGHSQQHLKTTALGNFILFDRYWILISVYKKRDSRNCTSLFSLHVSACMSTCYWISHPPKFKLLKKQPPPFPSRVSARLDYVSKMMHLVTQMQTWVSWSVVRMFRRSSTASVPLLSIYLNVITLICPHITWYDILISGVPVYDPVSCMAYATINSIL